MPAWDSYGAVYGAELRAAAREFLDHGWPVVEESGDTLMLISGRTLDVLEVPAAIGRMVCAQLRDADIVVPVAATPTGSWWYPVTPGAALPAVLQGVAGVVLHGAGDAIAAPPSQVPDGWVHWRVPPAACDYGVALRRLDLLRRGDGRVAAGRRRRTSGRPAARRCGGRRYAVLRRPRTGSRLRSRCSARSRRAVSTRDAAGATRRSGALPSTRPGSHPKRGRGRWITIDPGQHQLTTAPSVALNVVGRVGGNTRPTTLPPVGFPDTWRRGPGGPTAKCGRRSGRRAFVKNRQYGFVTTSQTPRSDVPSRRSRNDALRRSWSSAWASGASMRLRGRKTFGR